jgi:hypothetical protein
MFPREGCVETGKRGTGALLIADFHRYEPIVPVRALAPLPFCFGLQGDPSNQTASARAIQSDHSRSERNTLLGHLIHRFLVRKAHGSLLLFTLG